MRAFRIEMTNADGTTEYDGPEYETRQRACIEMESARAEGRYTDGRDAAGNLYAPNVVRVVEVTP